MDDGYWMREALALARRGEGAVEPNPMVGAVVVRAGQRVGAGWHERFGGPHAEVNALADAGTAARGADLYVTLEPCRHWGKTPPCVGAILQAGVSRVIAAMPDPNPEVSGRGLAELQAAGVDVIVGVEDAAARQLLAPYLRLTRDGRPWVIAKWAMSLDGKIATTHGESKWLTGTASRERVHGLRGRVDGILVGIGTALADDPLLTARPPGPRTPTRIVLDRHLRLPLTSQLVSTAQQTPLLICHDPQADPARRAALSAAGAECLALPSGDQAVPTLLAELGRRRWTNLLVEGGSNVLGSFLAADRIDEVWAFIAPLLLGGATAPNPLGGPAGWGLAQAPRLHWEEVQRLGDDWLCRGRVTRPDA